MADAEIRVLAHAVGFEEVAAKARAAAASVRALGETVRTGALGSGSGAQIERDMARAINGVRLGVSVGEDIRKGLTSSLASQSFWSRTFSGLQGRFKAAGRELGTTIAAGVAAGVSTMRGGAGRHGHTSHYDLHGGIITGGLALWGMESIADAAGRREQARLNIRDTGLVSDAQVNTLEALARSWKRTYKNLPTTESLNFLKDTLQILGGPEHLFTGHGTGNKLTADAIKGMGRIAELMGYMKTLHGGEHAGQAMNVAGEFANAIRSAEIFGRGTSVEHMADWVGRLTKISIATGVTPTDFIQAQRAAGASFFTLNDEALGIFAAYTQENKQRAGVQLMTSFMHMVGGNNQRGRGNQALQKLGLLPNDPKEVRELARQGRVKLDKQGYISIVNDMSLLKDYQKIGQNPYAWMAEDLYPSIREKIKHDKGYDIGDIGTPVSERSKEAMVDIMQQIGGAFSQRNEATQAVEAIVQYATFKRRADNIRRAAPDIEKRRASYLGQLEILSAQWDDFKVALGTSVLPNVIGVVQMMDSALKSIQGFTDKNRGTVGNVLTVGAGMLLLNGAVSGAVLFSRFLGIGRMFRFIEGAALIGTGVVAGIVKAMTRLAGVSSGMGAIIATGRLSSLAGRLGKLTRAIPGLSRVIGLVGRLGGLLLSIPVWAGYEWIDKTETGASWWEFIKDYTKYSYDKASGANQKTLDADLKRLRKSHEASNKKLNSAVDSGVDWTKEKLKSGGSWLLEELGLDTRAIRHRPRWLGAAEWQHRRRIYSVKSEMYGPFQDPDYLNLGSHMPSLPRRRVRNDLREGRREAASFGPVPVVIAGGKPPMPPPVINVTNNINVNASGLGAIAGAITGAVGPATASSVQNALSDQHH